MIRALVLLVLKLAGISAILFIFWQGSLPGLGTFWPGGLEQYWLSWQKPVLRWFYRVLELNADRYNTSWQLARGYVLSVMPFAGLMIVAGPAKWRRLYWGVLGLAIIGCWQIATPLILYLLQSRLGGGRSFFVGIFPVFMLSYSLPLILWVLFARDRITQWFSRARLAGESETVT
ncbi:hypothetical protein ACFLQW_02195 [Candidatus Zixiibacteriota bacterium]